MSNPVTSYKISRRTLFKVGGGLAAAAVATRLNLIQPAELVKAAAVTNTKKGRITPADRKAAGARLKKYQAQGLVPQAVAAMNPGGMPDYFGTIPNWANSPMPTVDATGVITGGGIHKFINSLEGLGPTGANDLGNYIPVGHPDTTTYLGSDYYEITLEDWTHQFHGDLLPTTIRGYRQSNTGTDGLGQEAHPRYLGPVIVAQRDRPVRIKFINNLATGAGGDLFIPTDTTMMGAGDGPQMYIDSVKIGSGGSGYRSVPNVVFTDTGGGTGAAATATVVGGVVTAVTMTSAGMGYTSATKVAFQGGSPRTAATATAVVIAGGVYSQNRATLHLHGGDTVWISDGTPHQWTTPATETTPYPKGVSVRDVPDMPATGPGQMTFFYSNQQSARLMFYHDHALGITRLNVYAGEVAGYLVQDPVEQTLVTGGTIGTKTVAANTIPADVIPLIIQDKTFLDPSTLVNQDPTWPFAVDTTKSNLWYPHVYMPNQNPYDLGGANAMGRWDYGPWFWPPFTGYIHGPVANPLAGTSPMEGPWNPGMPNPSLTPEAFMDTMTVNGTAYPFIEVAPRAYRFRILNGCNDRAINLSLFQADPTLKDNPLLGVVITEPGSGYLVTPNVLVGGTGSGAVALASLDPDTGSIASVSLTARGTGFTAPAPLTFDLPTGAGGVQAQGYAVNVGAGYDATLDSFGLPKGGKEIKMVPAASGMGLPANWPTDGRDGGVPDPATVGPNWIQIGTEGGLLPQAAVIPPVPVGFDYNRRSIVVLNILNKSLLLMPAERADVIVDFSAFAGKNVIIYNDAPAPVPAFDPRLDYFTCASDQTSTGGVKTTMPGYGPNTRTVMMFRVRGTAAPAFDLTALKAALPAAFAASQPKPVIPQARYAAAYPALQAATPFPADGFVRISDNYKTFIPVGGTASVTLDLKPKAIQELFEVNYARMNAILGTELPFTNMTTQTTIPLAYIDPATEVFGECDPATLVGSAGDGTQIWKITHNGVDTHGIHFHLFNVQLINRVGWDGAITPPDENELGWKDTVRMNPLEDCIVALRPVKMTNIPFPVPNSVRLLDPTMPLGSMASPFTNVDPTSNNPVTTVNEKVNFGWEYVWHCHILGHEENDMMRPMSFVVKPAAQPSNLVATVFNTPLRVVLTWTAPANQVGMTGLTIQRSTDPTFPAPTPTVNLITTIPVAANAITYTDTTVVANTTYYYRIMASNVVGGGGFAGAATLQADSLPSNTVQVGAPAAPTNLAFTQAAKNATVYLSWRDNSPAVGTPPNDVAEKNFTVQRATNLNGPWTTLSSTVAAHAGTGTYTNAYGDTKTLSGRTYYYKVFATNFIGSSAASNVLPVLTK
jgi:FtsP/CotA-like multicopper oxidase with cupredoxin domain